MNNRPTIGQLINVNRPGTYRVVRVYALGTCDVENVATGFRLRLTGLGWS